MRSVIGEINHVHQARSNDGVSLLTSFAVKGENGFFKLGSVPVPVTKGMLVEFDCDDRNHVALSSLRNAVTGERIRPGVHLDNAAASVNGQAAMTQNDGTPSEAEAALDKIKSLRAARDALPGDALTAYNAITDEISRIAQQHGLAY